MSKKRLSHLEEMEYFAYSNLQAIDDTSSEEYQNQQKDLVTLMKMAQDEEQIELQKEESKKKEKFEWAKILVPTVVPLLGTIGLSIYNSHQLRQNMQFMQIWDSENAGSSTAKQIIQRKIMSNWK